MLNLTSLTKHAFQVTHEMERPERPNKAETHGLLASDRLIKRHASSEHRKKK